MKYYFVLLFVLWLHVVVSKIMYINQCFHHNQSQSHSRLMARLISLSFMLRKFSVALAFVLITHTEMEIKL